MRPLILLLALWPGLAFACEVMAPADLVGLIVTYGPARQTFTADGTTTYTNGTSSTGRWRDDGGRYCSVWPPSDRWECYVLEREGATIRFTGAGGAVTVGLIE